MRECDELVWHMYERILKAARKSRATIDGYRYALLSLSRYLEENAADADILTAGQEHIADWLASITGTVSARTQDTYMSRARTFFKSMIKAGYLDTGHPMDGLENIELDEKVQRCPRDDDVEALREACKGKDWRDIRDRAMVDLLCEAGTPRAAELGAITLDALDLRHDCLRLDGKGGLQRVIALGARTCQSLTLWLRVRARLRLAGDPRTRHLLFFSKYGPLGKDGVRTIINYRWRKAGRADLGVHLMRRYTYDRWDAADGNPGAAMVLWGWRTPTMPALYGKQNAQRRALDHARALAIGDS